MTILPALIHYKGVNGELKHNSLVVLSDEMAHTVATVFAFLKTIVNWIKYNLAHIQQIHYLSDSPTSQYRNGIIFNLVSLHKAMFGISASWQYFESGHGKGPCDGVGGSVKRAADRAVKTGKLIKTAQHVYAWDISETQSAVTYLFVTKEEVKKASIELPSLGGVRVHGTMKTHAVMPVDDHIYIRETSCFRSCCWPLGNFHPTRPGWIKRKTRHESGHETPNEQLQGQYTAEQVSQETQEPPTQQTEEPQSQIEETESSAVKEEGIRVGTFVAVRYST